MNVSSHTLPKEKRKVYCTLLYVHGLVHFKIFFFFVCLSHPRSHSITLEHQGPCYL